MDASPCAPSRVARLQSGQAAWVAPPAQAQSGSARSHTRQTIVELSQRGQ